MTASVKFKRNEQHFIVEDLSPGLETRHSRGTPGVVKLALAVTSMRRARYVFTEFPEYIDHLLSRENCTI